MKKLLIAACMFFGVTGFVAAQQPAPKTTTTTSTSIKKTTAGKVVQMDNTKHVAASGLKADGTPDKRVSSEHGFGSRPHDEVVELAHHRGKASGKTGASEEDTSEYVEAIVGLRARVIVCFLSHLEEF